MHVFQPLVPNNPGYYKNMCGFGTLVPSLAYFFYNNFGNPRGRDPNESSYPEFSNPEYMYILFPSAMVMFPENNDSGSRVSTDLLYIYALYDLTPPCVWIEV